MRAWSTGRPAAHRGARVRAWCGLFLLVGAVIDQILIAAADASDAIEDAAHPQPGGFGGWQPAGRLGYVPQRPEALVHHHRLQLEAEYENGFAAPIIRTEVGCGAVGCCAAAEGEERLGHGLGAGLRCLPACEPVGWEAHIGRGIRGGCACEPPHAAHRSCLVTHSPGQGNAWHLRGARQGGRELRRMADGFALDARWMPSVWNFTARHAVTWLPPQDVPYHYPWCDAARSTLEGGRPHGLGSRRHPWPDDEEYERDEADDADEGRRAGCDEGGCGQNTRRPRGKGGGMRFRSCFGVRLSGNAWAADRNAAGRSQRHFGEANGDTSKGIKFIRTEVEGSKQDFGSARFMISGRIKVLGNECLPEHRSGGEGSTENSAVIKVQRYLSTAMGVYGSMNVARGRGESWEGDGNGWMGAGGRTEHTHASHKQAHIHQGTFCSTFHLTITFMVVGRLNEQDCGTCVIHPTLTFCHVARAGRVRRPVLECVTRCPSPAGDQYAGGQGLGVSFDLVGGVSHGPHGGRGADGGRDGTRDAGLARQRGGSPATSDVDDDASRTAEEGGVCGGGNPHFRACPPSCVHPHLSCAHSPPLSLASHPSGLGDVILGRFGMNWSGSDGGGDRTSATGPTTRSSAACARAEVNLLRRWLRAPVEMLGLRSSSSRDVIGFIVFAVYVLGLMLIFGNGDRGNLVATYLLLHMAPTFYCLVSPVDGLPGRRGTCECMAPSGSLVADMRRGVGPPSRRLDEGVERPAPAASDHDLTEGGGTTDDSTTSEGDGDDQTEYDALRPDDAMLDARERKARGGRRPALVWFFAHLAVSFVPADGFPSRAPHVATRVGEASHPGPAGSKLHEVWASEGGGLRYPSPHRDGFRAIASPGFDGTAVPRAAGTEPHALRVETANTTGWKGLKRRLRRSAADVILAQETWVEASFTSQAARWAASRGWKSIWCPATRGAGGGISAGAAVLARDWIGLRYPPVGGYVWSEARACAAVVDAPGHRPWIAVAAYCIHGQGASEANCAILAQVGAKFRALGEGWSLVMGADFNMEPAELIRTGFPDELTADVVAAANPRGTCRTRLAAKNYDFFVVAGELMGAVAEVDTVEASGNKTHTPVQLAFQPRPVALKALHLRPPPAIPTEEVFGPRPPPPKWEQDQQFFEQAVEAARTRPREEAERVMSAAYALWAYLAEGELADIAGVDLPKSGLRSVSPRPVWRSVLPERPPAEPYPSTAVLSWCKDLLREMARLCGPKGAADHVGLSVALRSIRHSLGRDAPEGSPCPAAARAMASTQELLDRMLALVDAGGDPIGGTSPARARPDLGGDPWTQTRADLYELLDHIGGDLAKQEYEEGREEQLKWKNWLKEGMNCGAANAHAFSRLPGDWQPTEQVNAAGIISSEPGEILEGTRENYADKWQAAQQGIKYAWPQRDALPRLSPAQLRGASRNIKKKTKATFDGFHPRHFGMLSEGALLALAAILEMVELLGAWPAQLDLVLMPLIPKPRGGFRPIGLLPGLYRLWAKARRAEADRWEAKHQRPFFAAVAGVGPMDVVWRQAAKQEAGVSKGQAAAAVMEDMESFYELLDRERLVSEAEAMGFPGPVVRASLAAYAAPRLLSLKGRLSKETHPRVGIIAGCSLATTYIKIYYIRMYDALRRAIPPSVDIDVYIDDTVLSSEGPPEQVMRDLTTARIKFVELVNGTLKGKIAESKSAVVSTSRAVAAGIRASCNISGPIHSSMVDLGVDYTAAKCRSAIRQGKRHARARQAVLRRKRLAIIRAVVGEKAKVIFTAGVGPSSAYDSPIWGLSDKEILSLRRTAAAAMRPKARGRSLTMTSLVHGVPTARFEIAPVLQYSRAIWMAVTNREKAAVRKCGLPDISGWWHGVLSSSPHLAAAYEKGAAGGTSADPKAAAGAWRTIRGPIGAAVLSLKRIGWDFTSPFTLHDDRGVELTLTHTTPTLLRDLLVAGVKRELERHMANKWAKGCPAYEGRRLCVDLAIAAVKPKADVTPLARGAYRASLCDAIMTMSRAKEGGYNVADECPLCRKKGDTRFHRIYECEKSAEAVAAAVPRWFVEEARRGDRSDPFWVTGAFPHPADVSPLPQSGVQIVWDSGPEDDVQNRATEAGGVSNGQFGGFVYIDGSCKQHAIADFTRAGSAVVMVDGEGRPRRRGLVPVPDHLPQTSQTAEGLALAVAIRFLTMEAEVKGDCLTIVRAANAPAPCLVAARRKCGGLLMDILRDPARRRLAGEVKWVKAHRQLAGGEDEVEVRDVRGNDAADKAAAEARLAHPRPSPEAQASIDFYVKRAPLVARAAAAALPLFPPAPGAMPRAKRPEDAAQAKERAAHLWQFKAGAWRCAICATWTRDDKQTLAAQNQRCPGPQISTKAAAIAQRGHVVCHAQGDLPFTFCARCGGWASRRCYLLKDRCRPPTAAGQMALRRIAQGLHPWRRKLAGGGEAKRGFVSTEAAFDADRGAWKRRRLERVTSSSAMREPHGQTEAGSAFAATDGGERRPWSEAECEEAAATALVPMDLDTGALARRDPRLLGTSMNMIIQALRNAPARFGPSSSVLVFNAAFGTVVAATIAALELERDSLRAQGKRDDDQGEHSTVGTSADAPSTSSAQPITGAAFGGVAVSAEAPSPFASRTQLLRHLRGPGPPAPPTRKRGAPPLREEPRTVTARAVPEGNISGRSDDVWGDRSVAIDAGSHSVVVAREGPRGGLPARATAVTGAHALCDPVAAVAEGSLVTTPQFREDACPPQGGHGEVTSRPASGCVAPLGDAVDVARKWRRLDFAPFPLAMSPARSASGEGPLARRVSTSPLASPSRLGVGPSNVEHALLAQDGTLPQESRGGGSATTTPSTWQRWLGAAPDATTQVEGHVQPQRGWPRHTSGARYHECRKPQDHRHGIDRDALEGDMDAEQGSGTQRGLRQGQEHRAPHALALLRERDRDPEGAALHRRLPLHAVHQGLHRAAGAHLDQGSHRHGLARAAACPRVRDLRGLLARRQERPQGGRLLHPPLPLGGLPHDPHGGAGHASARGLDADERQLAQAAEAGIGSDVGGIAPGSDVGAEHHGPCVHSGGAEERRPATDGEPSRGDQREADLRSAPTTRAQLVAALRGDGDLLHQVGGRRRNSDVAATAAAAMCGTGASLASDENTLHALRSDRQMKTQKCTSLDVGAGALHEIRGRSSSPGLDCERGGQDEAARDVVGPAGAPQAGGAIRGRAIAPGATRPGRITDGGSGTGAVHQATSPTSGARLPKRLRSAGDAGEAGPAERLAALRQRVALRGATALARSTSAAGVAAADPRGLPDAATSGSPPSC